MDHARLLAARQRAIKATLREPPAVRRNHKSAAINKSRLQRLQEAGAAGSRAVSDLERILSLPLSFPMEQEEWEAFNAEFLLPEAYSRGCRFLPDQPDAIMQYLRYDGAFLPMGVGCGKSLVSLVMADRAHHMGRERILLMCPPGLVAKLVESDLRFARTLVPLSLPVHNLHGASSARRRSIARRRPRGLYLFPYSLASAQDAEEVLGGIRPDLVIADEGHKLANFDAARTKRFARFMEEAKPEFCVMSGTITAKSLNDYAHLARWALGDNCFLPEKAFELREWSEMMDADASGYSDSNNPSRKSVSGLVDWARKVSGETIEYSTTGFRKAFQVRMNTTPGVYSSREQSVGASLIIREWDSDEQRAQQCTGWEKLQELVRKVEDEWQAPNGDEIDHAMHKFRWLYELSAGMYNNLVWPEPSVLASRRGVSEQEAKDLLAKAQEHHELGQDYAKILRKYLEDAPPGRDTPMLVGQDMYQHGGTNVPGTLFNAWKRHREADFEGRPERDQFPVLVCDYHIKEAVRWAKQALKKNEGGTIFVYNSALIDWTVDALRAAGKPAFAGHAGPAQDRELEKVAQGDPDMVGRVLVLSIMAHHEGKNLQTQNKQYYLQWPRPARVAEQALGRQHRNGQRADEVEVYRRTSTSFERQVFAACLNDALYIHQTLGSPQKLILADYDPMPTLYPPEILTERGMDPRKLSPEAIRVRASKFGL